MSQKPEPLEYTTQPVADLSSLSHKTHVVIMKGTNKEAEGIVVGVPWASGAVQRPAASRRRPEPGAGKPPLDMVRLAPLPGRSFTRNTSRAEHDFSLRGKTVLRVVPKQGK